ncbi:MAG: YggS family pyridoxal phosphate-dependent enzyme [Proteobacteria bacterium]|nr:YggS family pyridoxal phosphate-dependent enzyme [Pseudomonadota bacterium]
MISKKIKLIKEQINRTAQKFNRSPQDIKLLAVSKTKPIEDIIAAINVGQTSFGESYLQDAIPKIQALSEHDLEWHFIGALQSNKTRLIAENFDWVQSLDKFKHAKRLNIQRPTNLPPLNVCIQVNISSEPQKAGVKLTELFDLALAVNMLPNLRLRGLMALPQPNQNFAQQSLPFHSLYEIYQQLQNSGLVLDTLSMGMTNDMEAAIAEGSTLIRIGTGIFGKRLKTMNYL